MASQRPQRYLKPFLEPVAPSSLNMSPYGATRTPFAPNIVISEICPSQMSPFQMSPSQMSPSRMSSLK